MDDLLTETGVDVAPAGSASLLVSPWKNPIPIRPIAAFLTGPLIAIGLVPFLWRTALRRHQPRRFSAISGLGLLCLLIGGLLLISVVLPWLAG
jgi:hypothetical protein